MSNSRNGFSKSTGDYDCPRDHPFAFIIPSDKAMTDVEEGNVDNAEPDHSPFMFTIPPDKAMTDVEEGNVDNAEPDHSPFAFTIPPDETATDVEDGNADNVEADHHSFMFLLPSDKSTKDGINKLQADVTHRYSADSHPLKFKLELYTLAGSPIPSDNVVARYEQQWLRLPKTTVQFGPRNSRPQAAKALAPDISRGLGKRQSKKDLVALAKHVLAQYKLLVRKDESSGCSNLYVFEPPCWRCLSEEDAQRLILDELSKIKSDDCITATDTKEIYKRLCLERELFYEGRFDPPEGTINFLDGSYNVLNGEFYEHSPDDHFMTYVNVTWDDVCESANGDVFESFVENLSGGDRDVRTQLLELVGLLLTGFQIKHFFVLVGESGTGKSQFGRFLSELIGRDNVATTRNASDFADRWVVGNLKDKQLVTCLDLPNSILPQAAESIIKQLVGDDAIKGEQKYQNAFTMYRKPLLVMASNYAVRFRNMSEDQAMLNRMVCIPFRNPVPAESQQQQLYVKLLDEAPYIIKEAIKAFQELACRNYQVTRSELPDEFLPEEGNLLMRDIQQYVKECLKFDPGSECTTKALWSDYCTISQQCGLHCGSEIAFSRILSKVLTNMDAPVESIKRVNKTGPRGYRGIVITER